MGTLVMSVISGLLSVFSHDVSGGYSDSEGSGIVGSGGGNYNDNDSGNDIDGNGGGSNTNNDSDDGARDSGVVGCTKWLWWL